MRTLDAGSMGGDTGWGFRLVMLGVTIGGVRVCHQYPHRRAHRRR
jgi:hypothetical protein